MLISSMVLLALAASISAKQAPQPAKSKGEFLDIKREISLNSDPKKPLTKLEIALKFPPAGGKATVYFQAANVQADRCFLEFTAENFNKKQALYLSGKPFFSDNDALKNLNGVFKIAAAGDVNDKNLQLITIKQGKTNGRICQSNGDPHFRTFDGKGFSYQTPGCFVLMKSKRLVVQTMHMRFWKKSSVAVNKAVAIRYGKTIYIIDAALPQQQRLMLATPKENIKGIEVTHKDFRDFRFQLADGGEVKVTVDGSENPNEANKRFLNIQVVVGPTYFQGTSGLCGSYDNKQDNDFTKPNGQKAKNENEFGDSWKLVDGDADDMFVKKGSASGLKDMEDADVKTVGCVIPENLDSPQASAKASAAPPTGYETAVAAGANEYKVDQVANDSGMDDGPDLKCDKNAKFADLAKKACTKALDIVAFQGISGISKPSDNIEDCVKDSKLVCDWTLVDTHKEAYMKKVRTETKAIIAAMKTCALTGDPVPASAEETANLAKITGMGDNTCPQNCNNRGKCQSHGCDCDGAWSGPGCELDLNQLFTITPDMLK